MTVSSKTLPARQDGNSDLWNQEINSVQSLKDVACEVVTLCALAIAVGLVTFMLAQHVGIKPATPHKLVPLFGVSLSIIATPLVLASARSRQLFYISVSVFAALEGLLMGIL